MDLTTIRAHVGSDAARSATAMGAEAYATGEQIVFANTPDLETASHVHEVTHVLNAIELPRVLALLNAPLDKQADELDKQNDLSNSATAASSVQRKQATTDVQAPTDRLYPVKEELDFGNFELGRGAPWPQLHVVIKNPTALPRALRLLRASPPDAGVAFRFSAPAQVHPRALEPVKMELLFTPPGPGRYQGVLDFGEFQLALKGRCQAAGWREAEANTEEQRRLAEQRQALSEMAVLPPEQMAQREQEVVRTRSDGRQLSIRELYNQIWAMYSHLGDAQQQGIDVLEAHLAAHKEADPINWSTELLGLAIDVATAGAVGFIGSIVARRVEKVATRYVNKRIGEMTGDASKSYSGSGVKLLADSIKDATKAAVKRYAPSSAASYSGMPATSAFCLGQKRTIGKAIMDAESVHIASMDEMLSLPDAPEQLAALYDALVAARDEAEGIQYAESLRQWSYKLAGLTAKGTAPEGRVGENLDLQKGAIEITVSLADPLASPEIVQARWPGIPAASIQSLRMSHGDRPLMELHPALRLNAILPLARRKEPITLIRYGAGMVRDVPKSDFAAMQFLASRGEAIAGPRAPEIAAETGANDLLINVLLRRLNEVFQ